MKLVGIFTLLVVCILPVANPVLCSDQISVHIPPPRPTHINIILDFLGTPKLGEEITLVCLATPDIDIPSMRLDFHSKGGAEILSGPGIVHTSAKKGETKAYKVRVRFNAGGAVSVLGYLCIRDDKGKESWQESGWARTGHLLVVDEETGRFGTELEWRNSKLEYRYNPAAGKWLELGEPAWADWNRKIIRTAKKLEPALTDSEALCLHADIHDRESPYKWLGPVQLEADTSGENLHIEYLLENGWVEKHREGSAEKKRWLSALSDSLGKEWEGKREDFQKRELLELERMRKGDVTAEQGQEDSGEAVGCIQVTVRNQTTHSDSESDSSDAQRSSKPKLIWEKEFERNIFAVGVDEERFDLKKQNIMSCLKWVLLHGGEFRLVDTVGSSAAVETTKIVGAEISENTKYFMVLKWTVGNSRNSHYRLYDWRGRLMWRTKSLTPDPHWILNDGSSVFVKFRPYQRWGDLPSTEIEDVSFHGRNGRLGWKHIFPEGECIAGLSVSSSHIALTTFGPPILYYVDERGEVDRLRVSLYMFDKWGELNWVRSRIQHKWVGSGGEEERFFPEGVVTTDRGEALLVLQGMGSSRILVYDPRGALRDTLKLEHTGQLNSLRTQGKMAFASTGRPLGGVNRLFCYDFEENKLRFAIEEPDGTFQDLDVDGEAEVVAVAANESDTASVIMVYDFEGNYRCQVKFSSASYRKPWFRLLGKALLLAEENKLKLYTLPCSED